VDIDLSEFIFDEIMVEREGHAFYVEVVYKKLSDYCAHCQSIGHTVNSCHKLHPNNNTTDHPKRGVVSKPQVQTKSVPKVVQHEEINKDKEESYQEEVRKIPTVQQEYEVFSHEEPILERVIATSEDHDKDMDSSSADFNEDQPTVVHDANDNNDNNDENHADMQQEPVGEVEHCDISAVPETPSFVDTK
jgi:hypothetical protein